MGSRDETVEFENVECIAASKTSLLCIIDGDKKWVPKHDRVLSDDSEVYDKGHKGKLVVFEWWAKKEKMI